MTPPRHVVVVGAGLAGITAALDCADAGLDVTLLESHAWLGGLTHSFQRDGLWLDNGQHVFLRCCTAYLGLLERLGVADLVHVQPRLDIAVRSAKSGRTSRIRRSRLPAPLHLARALATYRLLRPRERLRAARAASAMRTVPVDARQSDETSFGAWLAEHSQSERSIETMWDLVGVATLNAPAAHASLALAATVFQEGLLASASAGDIGWSAVPLRLLHGESAAAALHVEGVAVRTRTKVRSVRAEGPGWVVQTEHDALRADAVVLATPPSVTEALLPKGACPLEPGWAARLGSSPILNLHVVLDRVVMDLPFLAAVDSPIQWVFDRTRSSGLEQGQYLAVSISAAHDLVEVPSRQLREAFVPALRDLLPAARSAQVRSFLVTREREATFAPAPGTARSRPPARTRLAGLALAGAWTATGWPATMEGAVRSGHAAARVVLERVAAPGDSYAVRL